MPNHNIIVMGASMGDLRPFLIWLANCLAVPNVAALSGRSETEAAEVKGHADVIRELLYKGIMADYN